MKLIFPFVLLVGAALLTAGFSFQNTPATEELKWYTWDEAVALNAKNPKKIMIDLYTDWCGWCKKMDKSTFSDPKVIQYIQEHFYPVKFNAEQKEDVVFNGNKFQYVETGNGRGVHTFAYSLLDGNMGYPSLVYLTKDYARILISPGYKDAGMLMTELTFTAEEHYNTTSWEEYQKSAKGK